jgi:hypothetical protein
MQLHSGFEKFDGVWGGTLSLAELISQPNINSRKTTKNEEDAKFPKI